MDENNNPSFSPAPENQKSASFSAAAQALGLDAFTFYSLVQRTDIPYDFDESGEFVISQEDLDNLVAAKD